MLDGLEEATRPLMLAARERLKAEKGEDATKAWNTAYALSGELTQLIDPYYPFENAPEVWGRSFGAMNIGYKGTTMRLDLSIARASTRTDSATGLRRRSRARRHVGAVRVQLYFARHPGRSRQREHGVDDVDARGGPPRLRQHRAGLASVRARARAVLGRARRDAVDVPRRPVRRRGVASALRQGSQGERHSVGFNRTQHSRKAPAQGDDASRDDRRAVL